ncbi:MAG TPA: hypothetical protein VKE71_08665 [Candidatus Angelobacter sp.]|nr:hypothetical protein [Candidatus Angelobacter sp.]
MIRLVSCLLCTLFASASFAAPVKKVTIPLFIEDHRIFVDAQFVKKDGSLLTARLWVDTGNPDFQITEKLARDLGLDLSGPKIKSDDGVPQVQVQLPGLHIGGMSLDLHSAAPMVVLGASNVFAGSQTDGNLPATILMHYQLVLDIPHRSMTLAQSGAARAKGTRVACLIQPKTGMVQIEATIDGKKYSLALDSGAPYSMISSDEIKNWGTQHADWPQAVGAAGPASLLPPRLLRGPVMRIPQINWGGLLLKNAGVVGMDPEFVSWYSKKTAAPVIGFLAWNILRVYRATIDYPHSTVYFEREAELDGHDMDVVGVALAHSRTGGYAVVAVVQKDGKPMVDEVQPGDKLSRVDDIDVSNLALEKVIDALAGDPGDVHILVLDRKGATLTIKAKVMRII